MAVDFLLDPVTGDLAALDVAGNVQQATGALLVAQRLAVRFNWHLGEWDLDITRGVPWRRDIFVRNPNVARISALMRDTISETPGVIQILSFDLGADPATRRLTVDFRVLTDEGEIAAAGAATPVGAQVFPLVFALPGVVGFSAGGGVFTAGP